MGCRPVGTSRLLVPGILALVLPAVLRAGEPKIELMLEKSLPLAAGQVAEAAPPTFVLREDGTLYLGGASEILKGRLEGRDLKDLRKLVRRVEKKMRGIGPEVAFGAGAGRSRLTLKKGQQIVAIGDPGEAPESLRPLASLVETLSWFEHPSCRLYAPERYRLLAKRGQLIGGCRPWTFPLSPGDALATAPVIGASETAGWPTGVNPALVCVGDKAYVVALRPLLPWE
jgi:hypothetical protein